MSDLALPVLPALLVVAVLASLAVLWLLAHVRPSGQPDLPSSERAAQGETFLFHDNQLVDHDVVESADGATALAEVSDWADLRRWLAPRFAGLPESLSALPTGSETSYDGRPGPVSSRVTILRSDRATRVILRDDAAAGPAAWHRAISQAHLAAEAQSVLDHAPFPIWKTDPDGTVTWRNAPCSRIALALDGMPETSADPALRPRFSVPAPDAGDPSWYEVCSRPIGDAALHFATDISEVIRAESARRDFVQTLTKTFANLTTGLAVFDRNRQLALFNPALVDLTGLAVPFLSARPDVIRFFDELRERQVLPEPKNYGDLRARIRDMIERASDGNYHETWTLPAGTTYRVTGRPHPNGAIAFLIEDISAEILKTRQFRSQIELGAAVIDGLDEAVVVLDSTDLIMLCNTTCSRLLGIDPDSSFADMSVHDLLGVCRGRFRADTCRSGFEAALRGGGSARPDLPHHGLTTRDGERFMYRIKPLPGGMRMLSFLALPVPARTQAITAAQ